MNPIMIYDDVATLRNIGQAVRDNTMYQNAFVNSLVNVIARWFVWSRIFDDPWAILDKGELEPGEVVEEIFVDLAKVHSYNPELAETTWMEREMPNVRAAYHKIDYQKFVKQTIQEDDLSLAFTSWEGVRRLVSEIVQVMYNTARYARKEAKKYMIAWAIVNGQIAPISHSAVTSQAGAQSALVAYRKFALDNREYCFGYNTAGVRNYIDPEDLVLIIDNDAQSYIDVSQLAMAFNMDKTDFLGRVLPIQGFDTFDYDILDDIFENDADYAHFNSTQTNLLATVSGVAMDRNFLQVYNKKFEMRTQDNGQGLYRQYWLHDWCILSLSPFANAAVFTTSSASISGVTVTPSTATVDPGQSVMLTASVAGSGIFNHGVTWSYESDSETGTVQLDGGNLHIGADVPGGTEITVTATSIADSTKYGSATVTVSGGESDGD